MKFKFAKGKNGEVMVVKEDSYTVFRKDGKVIRVQQEDTLENIVSYGYFEETTEEKFKKSLRDIHEKLGKQKEEIDSSMTKISFALAEICGANNEK